MAHVLDTLRKPGVSWRMLRPVALFLTLAAPAPLPAQVGLSSSSQGVLLTATRPGSIGVGLAPGGAATTWNLRPDERAAVTLVATIVAAGSEPEATDARVLFVRPMVVGSARGRRTDRLGIRTDVIGDTPADSAPRHGILTLRAITQ